MPKKGERKDFDWDLVDSLAILEARMQFVAERLLLKEGKEANAKTIKSKCKFIERRITERYNCGYVAYVDQKKESWRLTLRQKMRKAAQDGNITMMIFLSKQDLGYSDKVEQKAEVTTTVKTDEIDKLAEKLADLKS